jgi:alpha-1,2-mannosyltransferase
MRIPRPIAVALVAAALAWHALALFADWRQGAREQHGRDFASYYYAVDVALHGGDPYDKAQLGAAARDDATRKGVHPFFYPPPYLLTMLWVAPLDLVTAYRAWFWLDEAFGLLAVLALWWWWRPLGPAVGATLAASVALLTALPNNHLMGQMNLPVVLLVVLGLHAADRRRDVLGGVLVGAACMMKMSPAFFVAWWLLRGRFRPAAAAVATAVVLTLLSLPVVGAAHQLRFYTEVLPAFGSGRYNGLSVGIDIFGNHSLPNLYDELFPAGAGHLVLSDTARALTTATLLAVVALTAALLRRRPADGLAEAGQVGAVAAAMLLVPVFTYEHHLVWLWPAAAAVTAALAQSRLGTAWAVPVGLALAVWCFDLATMKEMALSIDDTRPVLAWLLRESKLGAVLVLYAAAIAVGRSVPGSTAAAARPTSPAEVP